MTLTPSQLNSIEKRANDYNETELSLVPIECTAIAHLVAVYRAALAWRDARQARHATQTRAGLAETSAEHHAAMRELPAAKEADVLACMALMSALETT